MKNLKRFVAMLMMATLFTTSFTSCIESDVSDAVDAVYLAQAEYLAAQAALKEAEAQHELAQAAYQEALAAVQLADAAYTDALTAGVILDNEGTAETNAYNAQMNMNELALAAAQLEVDLQAAMAALEEAQALHAAAMVALGEAVADAKNELIMELYADYDYVVGEVDQLQMERIEAEADLALKQLTLVPLNGTPNTDLVTMAYLQAMLEADLAESEADLVAAQAALAAAQAITPEDASDAQKWVTQLYEDAQALIATNDQLRVDREEAQIAADQAYELWMAATAQYDELMNKMNEVETVENEIDAHLADIATKEGQIEDHQENIDVNIPAAEMAVADAVTAYTAALGDLTAAQDALGEQTLPNPAFDDDKIAPEETLYDVHYNLLIDEAIAQKAYDDAVFYYTPAFPGFPWVAQLELNYTTAVATEASYVPGTPLATLQQNVDDTNAEEQAAQMAWEANPDGFYWFDPTDPSTILGDDILGEHSEDSPLASTTYYRVETWTYIDNGPVGPDPTDRYTPETLGAVPQAILAVNQFAIAGNGEIDPVAYGQTHPAIAAPNEHFVEVGLDDAVVSNLDRVWNARVAAYAAQLALDLETGAINSLSEAVATAEAALTAAYNALGYDFPADMGTIDYSDILAVEAFIADRLQDLTDATGDVADALGDVNDAIAEIGTPFTEYDDPAEWILLGGNDSVTDGDLNTVEPLTYFELVENALINWSIALQELAALGTVEWNQDQIDMLQAMIDDINALLPSHYYALDYLQAELDELAAEFNFDMTLWDQEYWYEYVPLYGDWLDAMKVVNEIQAEIDANYTLRMDIVQLRQAVVDNLIDDVTLRNVDQFMADVNDQINGLMTTISNLEDTIEIEKGLVAVGIIDTETANQWIAECERQLEVINSRIAIGESLAASLLARINALLN